MTALAPVEATADKTTHRGAESGLPVWWLRLGLAFVFGYAAVAALSAPEAFLAYFPSFLPEWVMQFALPSFAVYELALAGAFLSGRHVYSASLLAVTTLIGIVTFNLDAFDVLFGNIAIACAALALASVTQGEGPPRGRRTLTVRRRLPVSTASCPSPAVASEVPQDGQVKGPAEYLPASPGSLDDAGTTSKRSRARSLALGARGLQERGM